MQIITVRRGFERDHVKEIEEETSSTNKLVVYEKFQDKVKRKNELTFGHFHVNQCNKTM